MTTSEEFLPVHPPAWWTELEAFVEQPVEPVGAAEADLAPPEWVNSSPSLLAIGPPPEFEDRLSADMVALGVTDRANEWPYERRQS